MRPPLSYDDVEQLEVPGGTPEQHRAAADVLVGWAAESHPDDVGVTPAALLAAAAEHLQLAGDKDAALALFRRAVEAPGDAEPDKRCYLHAALLDAGDTAAARALADEIRRSGPDDPAVYEFVGENFEMAGDPREAVRWFTMGLTRMDRRGGTSDEDARYWERLTVCRRRARHALGYPPDELDLTVAPPSDA